MYAKKYQKNRNKNNEKEKLQKTRKIRKKKHYKKLRGKMARNTKKNPKSWHVEIVAPKQIKPTARATVQAKLTATALDHTAANCNTFQCFKFWCCLNLFSFGWTSNEDFLLFPRVFDDNGP